MLHVGEESSSQALDGTEVVVGAELDEAVGMQVLLLFLDNGVELAANTVLLSNLADLSKLLAKGMLLLGGSVDDRGSGHRSRLLRKRR